MRRNKLGRVAIRPLKCEPLEDRRLLATFTVTSPIDGDAGSFRNAIAQANENPGADTVAIDASLIGGTSLLNGPQIAVTESVTIHGSNVSGDHVIHANGGPGILDIQGTPNMAVTIRDLTFDGSLQDPATDPTTFPGQIESTDANLTLDRVSIINTVQPPTYATERTSALVARGNDVEISIDNSFFLYNSGGAQLANRNAVLLTATGNSNISITDSTISQSTSSARGLEVYLYDESDLTITGTIVTGNSYGGAYLAAFNQSTATITSSAFSANQFYGPGIGLSANGTSLISLHDSVVTGNLDGGIGGSIQGSAMLNVEDVLIQNNYSRYRAGGIGLSLRANGQAVLNRLRTIDNYAYGVGGGILATVTDNAQLELNNSTVADNMAHQNGGGIDIQCEYASTCRISSSLISGNAAEMSGGGIYAELSYGGTLEIANSTISGNMSDVFGGGIYLYSLTGQGFELSSSTITNNTSNYAGGGFYAFVPNTETVVAMNSVIADNLATTFSDTRASFNTALSQYNLIGNGDGSNLTHQTLGNLVGTTAAPIDPLLGPLADNGGASLTHALLVGSPARNAGDPSVSSPPQFDQRGLPFLRIDSGRIDIGAYEAQSMVSPDFDDDGDLDCDDIDALIAAIVAPPPAISLFDLDGDGQLSLADVDIWLDFAGNVNIGAAYLPGDANLDGSVDGQDFLVWNANKFTSTAAWCAGDFNADGIVDGPDFLIWNAFKFQSSDGTAIESPTHARLERPAMSQPSLATASFDEFEPKRTRLRTRITLPVENRMRPVEDEPEESKIGIRDSLLAESFADQDQLVLANSMVGPFDF